MCGRFTQRHTVEELTERFRVDHTLFEPETSFNIAPTRNIAVVVADAKRSRYLEGFRWGLVPEWARDATHGARMINARSETVFEKPAFREAIRRKRCLVPADGFYEWQPTENGRQPFHFRRRDQALFAFAGIWATFRMPDGGDLLTCSILTTEANAVVAPVHDRMPVILRSADEEGLWLDDSVRDRSVLEPLLRPFPDEETDRVRADRRVGSPANDFAALLTPPEEND
ncbi:MAG: SOS response-associated peptidase [Capsulimonadales bacterium]|nr:SOS response-associated peptidase [Capsulimonadales bacterium]